MQKERFKYLILITFLASILLIIFLQFNSGNSIENLIRGNKKLLAELQVQAKFQKLETNVVFIESNIRGLVITNDSSHVLSLKADIDTIQKELEDVADTSVPEELLQKLTFLVHQKIAFSDSVMHAFYTQGRQVAISLINTGWGRNIRDSLVSVIRKINENRQLQLENITESISVNGKTAKNWGIVLAIIAALASLITFWYMISQSEKQEKLIKTLDASEKKLLEASRLKEQFIANISHEIRTPMNAILGFAGLLQKTKLDNNQVEYVKSIRSSAENLLSIINDILDLSRIESGMMLLEKLPFNIRELLHSIITMMNVKAKNQGLYLKMEVDENIPQTLKGDAVRLTQILMNLIGNSLKFTHQGGAAVGVELKEKTENSVTLRFIVSDTGIGVEPEKQKAIFERFRQAEAHITRRYGGTGLGLSIVKQLVDLQNGTIDFESEVGKGTKVSIVLSYEIPEEQGSVSVKNYPFVEPANKKIKTLVAEDNMMNRQLIQHLLSQWQIEFDIVNNGLEAVKILQENSGIYNLILMDLQMPEMDGYAATEKIRTELKLSIPIIAMTAHALTGEREKCIAAGMNDYISKPINEELLYNLIHRYAQNSPAYIDLDYLRRLSKGDKEFEKSMIQTFAEQLPKELQKLYEAINKKDYEEIKQVAHHMKSTTSYIGVQRLTGMLQEIETAAEKRKEVEQFEKSFSLINEICENVLKEINQLAGRES